MAGRGTSGMNKRILLGLTLANPLRLIIPVILLVLAGRTFNVNAQTETNLYSFVGSPADGNYPEAGLVQGSDGSFYGTTVGGGMNNVGTVFRISPGGTYTNLHSFVGPPNDGGFPYAALVQGSDGNFYGTTAGVGTYGNGTGTVFRISPSGSYTNLYSFPGYPTNGAGLFAGLVQGSDGNFYGTTFGGGTGFYCGSPGCGTIFGSVPAASIRIFTLLATPPTMEAVPSRG